MRAELSGWAHNMTFALACCSRDGRVIHVQSRAGQDGQPLPTESLMAERDRLVQALATLDGQIAAARADLQALCRTDEQELCESRLIILQVLRCICSVTGVRLRVWAAGRRALCAAGR
jgi:hypothetical protein